MSSVTIIRDRNVSRDEIFLPFAKFCFTTRAICHINTRLPCRRTSTGIFMRKVKIKPSSGKVPAPGPGHVWKIWESHYTFSRRRYIYWMNSSLNAGLTKQSVGFIEEGLLFCIENQCQSNRKYNMPNDYNHSLMGYQLPDAYNNCSAKGENKSWQISSQITQRLYC